MENGGIAAMMHDLIAMDLKGWHPRNDVPKTKALYSQQMQSLDPYDAWWFELLQAGDLPCEIHKGDRVEYSTNPRRAQSKALYDHARATVPGSRHASDHSCYGL